MSDTRKAVRGVAMWFALTPEEQRFLAAVLALALLGLGARYWHLKHERPDPYAPPEAAQENP